MKLENLINQNRNLFDENEPENGHFERFQNKLEQNSSQKSSLKVYLMAASIVAVSLLATVLLYMIQAQTPTLFNNRAVVAQEISPEYQEVETYYNRYIEKRMDELNRIQCKNPALQKSTIMEEMQDFDKMFDNLQQELLKNGENERVMSALIETYQKKAEMIDQAIQIIKQNC